MCFVEKNLFIRGHIVHKLEVKKGENIEAPSFQFEQLYLLTSRLNIRKKVELPVLRVSVCRQEAYRTELISIRQISIGYVIGIVSYSLKPVSRYVSEGTEEISEARYGFRRSFSSKPRECGTYLSPRISTISP